MNFPLRLFFTLTFLPLIPGPVMQAAEQAKIVLVAGAVKKVDRVGHHDYLGGCLLLQKLLEQTPGVEVVLVKKDWPSDPAVFDGSRAIVFYTDGAGKQAYLETPQRVAVIQKLVDGGIGIVSVHQAVEFPPDLTRQSMEWIGAFYHKTLSGRGHWDSRHQNFPVHPATRGVVPWEINDGWLNRFKFPAEMKGITPLVWSGREHRGDSAGGARDVVAWTFERADGGRSFSFSGLDAHSAWEHEGVRQLMVNGTLWAAGFDISEGGEKCEADQAVIASFLTPREVPKPKTQ